MVVKKFHLAFISAVEFASERDLEIRDRSSVSSHFYMNLMSDYKKISALRIIG